MLVKNVMTDRKPSSLRCACANDIMKKTALNSVLFRSIWLFNGECPTFLTALNAILKAS